MKLAELQSWLQDVITHPRGASSVPVAAIERIVAPGQQLSAPTCVDLYADMYVLRLVDCLRVDFPCLAWTLGAERFDKLARRYVAAHPSTHFSLNQYGAGLAAFVAQSKSKRSGFHAELAALERALQDVFDARAPEPIDEAALRALEPGAWPTTRLLLTPALRLLAFRYPVGRFFQDFKDERAPAPPEARPTWLAVHRREHRVWRTALSREQFALLGALAAGSTLESALERATATPGVDAAQFDGLASWFHEWASEGLFVGLEPDA